MANKKTDIGKIVTSYLEKKHYEDLSNTQLAKIIFAENPIFESAENARRMVRYYKGLSGKPNKDRLSDRRFVRAEPILSKSNPHDIPESDAIEYRQFKLPKNHNKILLLADMHIPYHDVDALTQAISWGADRDINTIILQGDALDCYHLSYWQTEPKKRDFEGERDKFWRVMDIIQNKFPSAKVYYIEGNHEERWKRTLLDHPRFAKACYGMIEFELDIILRLGERNITWIADKQKMFAGKLAIVHGHEYKGGNVGLVNPARWLFMKTLGNTICAHFHRTSDHSEPNVEDELRATWSVGCLSELHPDYMPNNKWNHGFARVLVNDNETFKVTNLRIYNGTIL